jgi:hypothetical protein
MGHRDGGRRRLDVRAEHGKHLADPDSARRHGLHEVGQIEPYPAPRPEGSPTGIHLPGRPVGMQLRQKRNPLRTG